jgi:saccharopine dehydrogenase (NAD+, L-lysine-forming)
VISNIIKYLYIRKEINTNEKRVPIVPVDVKKLIKHGFTIYIESSPNRIFDDIEYTNAGGIITILPWYDKKFKSYLIIGIKEIDYLDRLNSHIHMYFSHSYTTQTDSHKILSYFKNSLSIILDFEYFYSNTYLSKQRLISFCYHAGIAGAYLGLTQYLLKKSCSSISNLTHFESVENLIIQIKLLLDSNLFEQISIGIIGPNGNTGLGVRYILDSLNISFEPIYKQTPKNDLEKYSILFNCIKLDPIQDETWFCQDKIYTKNIIIVDISCDYSKSNNPIKIYKNKTTWENPIYKPNEFVDIIAIENLPSLIPFDSSKYFSHILTNKLLLDFDFEIWNQNYKKYLLMIENI